MNIKALINVAPDILGVQPVFTGTRVPMKSLFDHLEVGISLNDFLNVTKEQAIALLDMANRLLAADNITQQYYKHFASVIGRRNLNSSPPLIPKHHSF